MDKAMGVTRRLFLNASWLFGGKTASGILAAIQTVVVARMLGVTDYGLLALVVAYVDILNQFFDFRVWETATKYIGTFWVVGEKDKARSMIKLSYIIDISSGVLAFLITVVTAGIASRYLIHSYEAYPLICIYALSLLIDTANSTSDAILRVFDRFKWIAFIASLSGFVKLALASTTLYLGMGIKGVLFSYIAASFLGFSIRLWAVSTTLRENRIERWRNADLGLIKDQWKGIAWFLGNTSLTATIKMASDNYLGVLLLGHFSGKEAAAYYKVAKSSLRIVTRIVDPLREAIYPELVKMFSTGAMGDFKRLLKSTTKNLSKVVVPMVVFFLVFSDPLIEFVFGERYLPSSNALRIITLAALISQVTFWTGPALLAFGKVGLKNVISIICTAVYVGCLFLLIPRYSYLGAAFAFLVYYIVSLIFSVWVMTSLLRRRKERLKVQSTY
ncbi:MAG TPA: flippase [Thermodesulfobacteriota bacterium]|nr:flippase [Thermodesulfobacteriota bacterium]